jgi:micrococcal nuclease
MGGPPEWQLGRPRPHRRTLWSDLGGLWYRFRALPTAVQLLIGAVAFVMLLVLLSVLFGSENGTNVASRSTTSRPRSTTTFRTTTTVALPPGDDKAVKSVIDGDSFEIDDGTTIRLIGIDAPDVEISACFSAEATTQLRELLPAGRQVRLVYDTTRTDRFGRTLAYVYRHPDGMFVNVALVRDGFAAHSTSSTNTAHAEELAAAESSARSARVGLWQTCSTTTVPTTRATTATTAAPATTTTVEAETTTSSPGPTTQTTRSGLGTVVQGAACSTAGTRGTFSNGADAVCTQGSDGSLTWQPG